MGNTIQQKDEHDRSKNIVIWALHKIGHMSRFNQSENAEIVVKGLKNLAKLDPDEPDDNLID